MTNLEKARWFAAYYHRNQKYGKFPNTIFPYTKHLEDVYTVTTQFQLPPWLQEAAWLHDILEDTEASFTKLVDEFGIDTANGVWSVTGEGPNRKARNKLIYERIAKYPYWGVPLKLADRIANVRHSVLTKSKELDMYRKEYPEFQEAIRTATHLYDDMWEELDRLMK